jgi:hypothetical protein
VERSLYFVFAVAVVLAVAVLAVVLAVAVVLAAAYSALNQTKTVSS